MVVRSKSMVAHPVVLTAPQMRVLKSGGAITLKPQQFVDDALHRLVVAPQTARRIQTALGKVKGLRISLKPGENLFNVETGEGIFDFLDPKKNGVAKAFDPKQNGVADAFKPGGSAEQFGKQIASTLIHQGIPVVAGTLGGIAGTALAPESGPLGGMAGSVIGSKLGAMGADRLGRAVGYGMPCGKKRCKGGCKICKGSGFFKGLKKYTGINKSDVISAAKFVGKQAAHLGAQAAGEALGAYTGNPVAGQAFASVLEAGADRAIDSGSARKGLSHSGKAAKSLAKDIAISEVDKIIDSSNLGPTERRIAEKALAGKYPSAKDIIYDYGKAHMASLNPSADTSGGGLKRRGRPSRKTGCGSAYVSTPYNNAMTSLRYEGAGTPLLDQKFSVNDAGRFFKNDVAHLFGRGTPLLDQKFSINEAGDFFKHLGRGFNPSGSGMVGVNMGGVRHMGMGMSPMTDLMTLDPVAKMSSPQMNPFIPSHNPYKTGRGFNPSGSGMIGTRDMMGVRTGERVGRGFKPSGSGILDDKFSINDAGHFFKNDVAHLFGKGAYGM